MEAFLWDRVTWRPRPGTRSNSQWQERGGAGCPPEQLTTRSSWRGSAKLGPQPTALLTSSTILASSALVSSERAKVVGHMAPSSR